MKPTSWIPALFAFAALILVASGCGKSPTSPDPTANQATIPPTVGIRTPLEGVVTSISVTRFPSKKSDGSDWDLSAISSSRRPDLYVVLQVPGHMPDYTSGTTANAESGKTYSFNTAASALDGSLPQVLRYDASHRIYVMDEDVGGDDDRVGWITVNLPAAYRQDNSRTLDYTYTDTEGRLSVRIRGTWSY
ncbi:MAG TPA: hypothetical protein VMJ70_06280 [Candidatus Sulfotelmatobacter sp.]|nr:hypothetical protein [Candidatus Sulfotelmatobacter sp.]